MSAPSRHKFGAERLEAHKTMCSLFGLMDNMKNMSPGELRAASEHLVKTYSSDLELTLSEEIVQFAEFVRPNVQQLYGNVEVEMYRILIEPEIRETFPNVEVALRLYLTLLVSNCTGERLGVTIPGSRIPGSRSILPPGFNPGISFIIPIPIFQSRDCLLNPGIPKL